MGRSRCLWPDATAARRNLDPQELALHPGKLTGMPKGARSRAYLFLGGNAGSQRSADDQRAAAMIMALVPPLGRRTKQLLALTGSAGAGASNVSGRHGTPRVGRPIILTMLVAALLMVLLSLGVAPVGLTGYLTLIVMTLALASGLSLVAALVQELRVLRPRLVAPGALQREGFERRDLTVRPHHIVIDDP